MTNPNQDDLFDVGREKKTPAPRQRRYVFEALCYAGGLDPHHPGKFGGGMIQRWEMELRDRHGIPDTEESFHLIAKMAKAYEWHPTYGGAGMPLTAKALVDAWPRLNPPKSTRMQYGVSPKEQAELDRESREAPKHRRRNELQREIARDIINEHGGESADAVQAAYMAIPLLSTRKRLLFDVCIQNIADRLTPGEIDRRLDTKRRAWLRRYHEAAKAIVDEADPARVEAEWGKLQKAMRLSKKRTTEQHLPELADLVSPGELARRMEADDAASSD